MKQLQSSFMLVIIFIIGGGLVSCKKDTGTPKPNCKVIAITSGTNATSLTYNTEGKLSSKNAFTTFPRHAPQKETKSRLTAFIFQDKDY
jgi:YD repeat-containing protein